MPRKHRRRYRIIDSRKNVLILSAIIIVIAVAISLIYFTISSGAAASSLCKIHVYVNPDNTGNSISSPSQFYCISGGTPQSESIQAIAGPGYTFQSWTVSGGYVDCEKCASTNLWADSGTSNVSLIAIFAPPS